MYCNLTQKHIDYRGYGVEQTALTGELYEN